MIDRLTFPYFPLVYSAQDCKDALVHEEGSHIAGMRSWNAHGNTATMMEQPKDGGEKDRKGELGKIFDIEEGRYGGDGDLGEVRSG